MGVFSYIGDVAKAISKTAAGEGSGISKAFAREAFENLDNVAVRQTQKRAASNFLDDAVKNNAITQDVLDAAKKADGFDVMKYADEVAKNAKSEGTEGFAKTLRDYRNKSQAFNDYANGNLSAAKYFDSNAKDGAGVGVGKQMKAFFADEEYGSIRKKTVLGGAAATAVGVRYLSGGDLTTNARGERDIAGIPFI